MQYRIEYQEGHGLRTDPDAQPFQARNDQFAKVKAADLLEIKGRLTKEKFHATGALAIYRGNHRVFPRRFAAD